MCVFEESMPPSISVTRDQAHAFANNETSKHAGERNES